MSNFTSKIEYIALNKLSASKLNVRKKDRKADIEMLAASIASHGLLQNLNAIPKEQGRYDVVAGGRRLAALKLLASNGDIPRDFAVPCQVTRTEDAEEASLAENIQRSAMDPMDEVEAFASLGGQGFSVEDIARRFGCEQRHVAQRLALARLSPKLKSAYRRGDLSLDAARAFCITDDLKKQEAVFKALGRHVMHASNVHSHLMKGAMRVNDRIARFVGLEAYEAAGGRVTRDLFQESEAYVDDPALMTRLADERLESDRKALLADGWGWVNVNLASNFPEGGSGERLYPSRRAMTAQESAASETLEAEEEALNEALEDADEDDERWSRLDDLAAQRHALFAVCQEWDVELQKLAGALITLDHNGRPNIALGFVAKQDAAKFRRLKTLRQAAKECASEDDGVAGEGLAPPWEAPLSNLPKTLTRELTQIRTRALRTALRDEPGLALGVAVFAMSSRVRGPHAAPGIALQLGAQAGYGEESEGLCHELDASIMPSDDEAALAWCLEQSPDALLRRLAALIASALDFSHEGASRQDGSKHALADLLAGEDQFIEAACERADFVTTADTGHGLELACLAQQGHVRGKLSQRF